MRRANIFDKIRSLRVDGGDWASGLALAIVFGLFVVFYYGWQSGSTSNLVAALLMGGACLLVGAFLGFLFGIPRSLQSELPPTGTPDQ